jgi:pimeloyl-ACP methyl ester carboxylesterase
MDGMSFVERDGVTFYYQKSEGAGPPVLLLHGWCCDHSYLAPQFSHFAAKGHRVIAPDLRGHGRSDKPAQSYPIEAFTDDVAWLCGELRLERPLVIGHSMGGIVAFDLAVRYPQIAGAIVMLDAAIVLPAGMRRGFAALLGKLQGPDYQNVLRGMAAGALFMASDDAARKAEMLDRMVAEPQHVMVAAFAGLAEFDAGKARGHALPPALYIAAGEANPRCDAAQLREIAPTIQFEKISDVGHFCQLEAPDDVNAMIDRFLSTLRDGVIRSQAIAGS